MRIRSTEAVELGRGKGTGASLHTTQDKKYKEVGRRRPDFFMVGAPKAGTSSLFFYLKQHPDVFMSDPKEPHFFYDRASPGRPVLNSKDLEGYLRLFEGAPQGKAAGEGSTSYLWLPNAASEIRQLQPEARVIILLRDPVERAWSQYWYQVRDDRNEPNFEKALGKEPERIRRGAWHGLYYVECGMYSEQVGRYLDTFGRDSVRVYLFEDLVRDALGVCRDAFEFLGVDPDAPVEAEKVYNRGGAPRSFLFAKLMRSRVAASLKMVLPPTFRQNLVERIKKANNKPVPQMDPKTEARLRGVFREDVERLEEMIGRDLSHWKG